MSNPTDRYAVRARYAVRPWRSYPPVNLPDRFDIYDRRTGESVLGIGDYYESEEAANAWIQRQPVTSRPRTEAEEAAYTAELTVDPTPAPITTGHTFRIWKEEWPWFRMRLLEHEATACFAEIPFDHRMLTFEFGMTRTPRPELTALFAELEAARQLAPDGRTMLRQYRRGATFLFVPNQAEFDKLFTFLERHR